MPTHWYTSDYPPETGFYLLSIRRPDGTRFVGYGFFDGEDWLTANRKFNMTFDILAWALLPEPYDGPTKKTKRWA